MPSLETFEPMFMRPAPPLHESSDEVHTYTAPHIPYYVRTYVLVTVGSNFHNIIECHLNVCGCDLVMDTMRSGCAYIRTYIHMYIRMYVCTCTYMCMYVCMHIHYAWCPLPSHTHTHSNGTQ